MFLLDTNIWLELLLEQEKSDTARNVYPMLTAHSGSMYVD